MRSVQTVFVSGLLAFAPLGGIEAAPLGTPGVLASYASNADLGRRPEFERERGLSVIEMKLGLGPSQEVEGRLFQWGVLRFTRANGHAYEAWLLLDAWPSADRVPAVARYLWREPTWPDAVEFVSENSGRAALPRLSLWEYGWPRSMAGGPLAVAEGAFPKAVVFQGFGFDLVGVADGQELIPPAEVTVVRLNPDLVIGHMTRDTDVAGRPSWALPDGKYQHRKTAPDDHRRHFEAGFSLFQATPRPEWLTRSEAWDNNLFWLMDDWPAQLYRSNYWGRGIYVDEPGIHNRALLNERLDLAGRLTPAEAVASLQERLEAALRPTVGNYSQVWINEFIDRQFGRGDLWIVERDYPVWEALWTTAWYQLAVDDGVAGLVDEDTEVGDLVEGINRAFGTQIPPTVENACAIRVAVLRGAARNFSKRWGVAFYSPSEPRLKAATIPILYRKGASYFWVWTGWEGIGDNSGLPYSYQRYYASLVKQAQAAEPQRNMGRLLSAAKTCIVIPYGYTFAPGPLQGIRWLHLEREPQEGVSYRRVLTNAALEVERCLRSGTDFDIAVDDPKFTAVGYDEIIRCREDGTVAVRVGGVETALSGGREPVRPDLGPGPSVSIQAPGVSLEAPCTAVLEAVATAGTGEFEHGRPRLAWEVYGPGQDLQMGGGDRFEAELAYGGTYRVRVAVADVFGRPAVAWAELQVGETRTDAAALAAEWAFQTDPGDTGLQQGRHRMDYDDGRWSRIPVPAWWENTPAGAYDGYAWYRVRFTVAPELEGRELCLEFAGVDESAWVYLNGDLIGERSAQSTGRTPADFWDEPFRVPVQTAHYGKENVLAVRVHDSDRMGGIFRPVRLLVGR